MKYIKYIFILIILAGLFVPIVKINAQTPNSCAGATAANPCGQCILRKADGTVESKGQQTYNACRAFQVTGQSAFGWTPLAGSNYQLLAPLPCTGDDTSCSNGKFVNFDPKSDANGNTKLGEYLNLMIKILIGIAAVLSVVMIVMGGLEYMTSELISSKEEGKKKILGAIFGLVLALGAYILLFTINPDLLNSDLNPPNTTVTPTPNPNNQIIHTPTAGDVAQQAIDVETGRSIYSIHTMSLYECSVVDVNGSRTVSANSRTDCEQNKQGTWKTNSAMCSVAPEGYNPATLTAGTGILCGTTRLNQASEGFQQFCCKYDRLQR